MKVKEKARIDKICITLGSFYHLMFFKEKKKKGLLRNYLNFLEKIWSHLTQKKIPMKKHMT